jgi:hypothetical protein
MLIKEDCMSPPAAAAGAVWANADEMNIKKTPRIKLRKITTSWIGTDF